VLQIFTSRSPGSRTSVRDSDRLLCRVVRASGSVQRMRVGDNARMAVVVAAVGGEGEGMKDF